MTEQSAVTALDAIARLLRDREAKSAELSAIDEQIARLAGIDKETRPRGKNRLSPENFRRILSNGARA